MGNAGGCTDKELDAVRNLLSLVADSPVVPAHWLDASSKAASSAFDRYCAEHAAYQNDKKLLLERYQDGVFDSDIDKFAEKFLGEYEQFWKRWFNKAYSSDVSEVLNQRLDLHRKAAYGELRNELGTIRSVKQRCADWASDSHEMRIAFGPLFEGVDTDPSILQDALKWFKRFEVLRNGNSVDPVLAETLKSNGTVTRELAGNLYLELVAAQEGISDAGTAISEIFLDVPNDRALWIRFLGDKLDAMEEAPRYCQYRKWIADARLNGCGKLLDAIRDDQFLEPEQWRIIFERVFDASLIDFVHRTKPALAAFDRENHERLRERYAFSDQENVDNGGKRVAEADFRSCARPHGLRGISSSNRAHNLAGRTCSQCDAYP